MVDYYDKLLGSIAAGLLVGVLIGAVTSIAFHQGVLFGSLIAMVFVFDALFGHPPLPETDRDIVRSDPDDQPIAVRDPTDRSRFSDPHTVGGRTERQSAS